MAKRNTRPISNTSIDAQRKKRINPNQTQYQTGVGQNDSFQFRNKDGSMNYNKLKDRLFKQGNRMAYDLATTYQQNDTNNARKQAKKTRQKIQANEQNGWKQLGTAVGKTFKGQKTTKKEDARFKVFRDTVESIFEGLRIK